MPPTEPPASDYARSTAGTRPRLLWVAVGVGAYAAALRLLLWLIA